MVGGHVNGSYRSIVSARAACTTDPRLLHRTDTPLSVVAARLHAYHSAVEADRFLSAFGPANRRFPWFKKAAQDLDEDDVGLIPVLRDVHRPGRYPCFFLADGCICYHSHEIAPE